MGYLFLIIAMIVFLVLEYALRNIWWIGIIVIAIFIISIIRSFGDYKIFGFDFWEFVYILLRLAGIGFIIYLMIM